MKRFIKKIIKPEKSFNQWALENNVALAEQAATKSEIKKKSFIQRFAIITASVFLIGISIIFPIVFNSSPNLYSAHDAASTDISLDELYSVEDLLLFKRNQIIVFPGIFDEPKVNKELLKNNQNILLSYMIWNCLIATTDGKNSFWVDYRIRTNENYEFLNYTTLYEKLENWFEIGNTKFFYKISSFQLENISYLKFTYDNYEYFLKIKGHAGVTDMTEENLKLLMNDLLTENR